MFRITKPKTSHGINLFGPSEIGSPSKKRGAVLFSISPWVLSLFGFYGLFGYKAKGTVQEKC